MADDRAQPGRAQLRRAAGERQQPGSLQHRVLGDAGHRLPRRPPRRDARSRRRGRRPVRRRAQHRRAQVPARRRQRRHRGRDQHRGAQGLGPDAAAGLRRSDRAVLRHLPQLARGDRRGGAADHHLDPVRGADGRARHRRQGRDAAGDRARRRHRHRLRAVPAVGAARAAARSACRSPSRIAARCASPARWSCWSA